LSKEFNRYYNKPQCHDNKEGDKMTVTGQEPQDSMLATDISIRGSL